ncbi:VWA domain-containing protein [Methylomagnum sp.]
MSQPVRGGIGFLVGRPLRANWRLVALLLAAIVTLATFFHPRLPLPRSVYRYMFVLDITQSMNARDYHAEGFPAERLNYAKESIRRVLHDLPCGSEAGLGLFTTQNVQFLFEPIEICGHFSVIDDVLSHIDWRMAWAANSNVTSGLYAALRELAKRDPDVRLVFFTDGQETPPLTLKPSFTGKPGGTGGVLVGVGGPRPTVVPRYDRENRYLGDWQNVDIEPPPVSSTDYSEMLETHALPREGVYLSWLDESHLKELSAVTGLRYHRLEDPAYLSKVLRETDFAERRPADTDLRPPLGLAALTGLLLVYMGRVGLQGRRP